VTTEYDVVFGMSCIDCYVLYRVNAIYPVQNQAELQDPRVMSLIQYAKKVEKSIFEVARGRVS